MTDKPEVLAFSQNLLAEAESREYYYSNLEIKNLPSFEELKKSSKAFKKEVLRHSLRQANVITGEASHHEKYDHLNIALHREVVLSLLRAYLDFSPTECIELLRNALMPYEERNMTVFCFWFPLAKVLKHLEKSLEKQTLNQEEQDFLKQCLTTKVGWGNPLKDALALQIKQVIALNEHKVKQNQEISQKVKNYFDSLVERINNKNGAGFFYYHSNTTELSQELLSNDISFKKGLLNYSMQIVHQCNFQYKSIEADLDRVKAYRENVSFRLAQNCVLLFLKNNCLGFSFDELVELVELAKLDENTIPFWFPMLQMLKHIEKTNKKQKLNATEQKILKQWLNLVFCQFCSGGTHSHIRIGKDLEKVKFKIKEILTTSPIC